MKKIQYLILASALLLGFTRGAYAHSYQWEDPKSGVSISFPDDWKRINAQKPDMVFSIIAPDPVAQPICSLRVQEDKRFQIYPRDYERAIQKTAYSQQFWKTYLNQFFDVTLHDVKDDAALGQGHASYAFATYQNEVMGKDLSQRRGLAFATLYQGQVYVLDCSVESSAFPKWLKAFESITKTVEFQNTSNGLLFGHYRDSLPNNGYVFKIPGQVATWLF
jgi:hypothetical protein